MIDFRTEQPVYAFRDETAALQWAIEALQRNGPSLKTGGTSKEWLAYIKTLLLGLERCVETIQHGGAPAIVVPESYETLHRIDNEELLDLIRSAREEKETREYVLAVAGALIENGNPLPGPLKEFVVEFLRNPQEAGEGRPGRKRSDLAQRDNTIGWVVAMICLRWKFSPTRNEATEESSAVSITQKALDQVGIHLTEATITKIWNNGCWKQTASIE